MPQPVTRAAPELLGSPGRPVLAHGVPVVEIAAAIEVVTQQAGDRLSVAGMRRARRWAVPIAFRFLHDEILAASRKRDTAIDIVNPAGARSGRATAGLDTGSCDFAVSSTVPRHGPAIGADLAGHEDNPTTPSATSPSFRAVEDDVEVHAEALDLAATALARLSSHDTVATAAPTARPCLLSDRGLLSVISTAPVPRPALLRAVAGYRLRLAPALVVIATPGERSTNTRPDFGTRSEASRITTKGWGQGEAD